MFRWQRRDGGGTILAVRFLLLLLLLLHEGANQGFELLDAIANTNGDLSMGARCIGAGESDVLAYASLARKLTIASDSVDGRQSVSFFLYTAIFDQLLATSTEIT